MTTYIPKVYAFSNDINHISKALADHIIKQQNLILFDSISSESLYAMSREEKEEYLQQNKYVIKRKNSLINHTNDINSVLSPTTNSYIETLNKNTSNTSNVSKASILEQPPNESNNTSNKINKLKKKFRVGISGGSLLDILQHGLLPRQEDIFWSLWEVFLIDERLVPFQDPESNYGKSKRKLFSKIDSSQYGKPKVYHIDESLIYEGAVECAENYANCLINKFASRNSVKWPCFDLILLGVAPDGHIGSLFPNRKELRENSKWVIPITDSPVGVQQRVTLTIPVICNAAHISFVVEGLMKQPIMEKIMEKPELGLPSSLVNEGALKKVSWFVDEDAIKGVHVIKRNYEFDQKEKDATAE
ncbi:hypothetical protein QEN19_000962 [Hanseniaspora menglaensis]